MNENTLTSSLKSSKCPSTAKQKNPPGTRATKNIPYYFIGSGAVDRLKTILESRRRSRTDFAVFCIDQFFQGGTLPRRLTIEESDEILFVDTSKEPTTTGINALLESVRARRTGEPCAIVGIGGGSTLDTAKALSNLFTNGGRAEDYQGWDLVKQPGVFKVGIPTLSGTGAESSRTCVMINPANGLKLGMNSDHTLFDQLILDPELTRTVPRDQYFFSGMDTYIHCIESLKGRHRHPIGDAFSRQALSLCREVFLEGDMKDDSAREKLMVASYLGGCAIANSFVGVVHPFSAGLSVVLGIHHCLANCIALNALAEFYPEEATELREMAARQKVSLPSEVCHNLTEEEFDRLYRATVIHEKPLANALGDDFRIVLTLDKVTKIFKQM